jgi:DNA polymerase III delta prime subunit
MWLRKHAPRELGQVALSADNRRTFESYLARREIPRDLILVGDPGHGKSTVAAILESALAFHTHLINASGRRGIDVVRGQITDLVTAGGALARELSRNPGGPYRIIRLEEAQGMTPEALAALRTVMDHRPDWVRLIFTCNELPGDEAVVDRCRVLEFRRAPVEEQVRVVERILSAEGLVADRGTILACANAAPTMRWLISHVQESFSELGRLMPPRPARSRRLAKTDPQHQRMIRVGEAVLAVIDDLGQDEVATADILLRMEDLEIKTAEALGHVMRKLGAASKMRPKLGLRGYSRSEVVEGLSRARRK